MKTLKLFLLIAITTLLFTTCKKYPEGGWSNVAIKHLFGGHKTGASKTWYLKKYEVNGIDSIKFITPGNGVTNFENDKIIFINGSGSDNEAETKVYKYGIAFTSGLKDPKIKVVIKFIGGTKDRNISSQCYEGRCERNVYNPALQFPAPMWDIIKLKADEVIISTTINSNNYKIILTNENIY